MPTITLIIGPQKPVFCTENLPGLPGSRDDADELVDGPDRLLGASALGGRRPFLGGEIMESSVSSTPRRGKRESRPSSHRGVATNVRSCPYGHCLGGCRRVPATG